VLLVIPLVGGLQSEHGENGDFQPLYMNISRKQK